MDMDKYQEAARATAVYQDHGEGTWVSTAYAALGLAGEAGEVANKVKKINRDDDMRITPERRDQLMAEAGGVMWYLAALADELGTTLSIIAERNLGSLADRAERGVIWGDGDER